MKGRVRKIEKLVKLPAVLRALGTGRLARLVRHRVAVKSGLFRWKCPSRRWDQCETPVATPVGNPFDAIDLARVRQAIEDPTGARLDGDRVLDREMPYFGHAWMPIPATWRENPLTGYRTPSVHWSAIPDFDFAQGDIKWIWEPSRFDWVYVLARAYAATGEDSYVEGFWTLLEDWRLHNPPNAGINWKCGQEASFRMFALAFAHGAFRGSPASTPERRQCLWQTFLALAERVDSAIGYALAQRNNHGLSESAALYLAGSCLSDHRLAMSWRDRGKSIFEELILDQFARDGAYIQHSFVYERLALRDAVVFLLTARQSGDTVSVGVKERLEAACRFMTDMTDPESGMAPNYGANDGANVMSLSTCGYLDFRPIVQIATALVGDERAYPSGPWDEELAWHGLGPTRQSRPTNASLAALDSGYFKLVTPSSFGLIRCHTYTTRPAHADMLALELWAGGRPLLLDAGTFQYYDVEGLGTFLKGTAAHSTVEVNRHSQMTEWGRFLWLDWTEARLIRFDAKAGIFVGEHFAYRRFDGVVHRRTVIVRDGDWLIVDDLSVTRSGTELTLRWRLAKDRNWIRVGNGARASRDNISLNVHCSSDHTIELVSGFIGDSEVAQSRYYGSVESIDLIRACLTVDSDVRWVTAIGSIDLEPDSANGYLWHGLRVAITPGSVISEP
ncbi:MAG: alginate lyase family protein [Fimbriimonas sp.]|nr:alginate lyase family protein [Fimbriimonas sp.]